MPSGAAVANEREAREQLVACGHALWQRGLIAGTSGNLSARIENGYLITPTGSSFYNLKAESLVRLNERGEPEGSGRPSIERPLHLASYRARSDIRFVVHTHPTFCVVWAGMSRLYPRDTVAARESLPAMNWVPYFAPGSVELANAVEHAVADGTPLALLEHHGLIAVSADLDQAFIYTDMAEECAKVAFYSL